MWTSGNYILRAVQWDLRPPVFFIIWTSMGHWPNKIFSILVQISLSYLNFYESPWGIILWGVNLPGVSYCAESISPGYHNAQSLITPGGVNSHFFKLLHKPLKEQCHKNKYGFIFYYKRAMYIFHLWKKFWDKIIFLLRGEWYPEDRESAFFSTLKVE